MRWIRTLFLFVLALIITLPLLMTIGASLMGPSELMEYIGPVVSGTKGMAVMPLLPGKPTLQQYVMVLLDSPKFLTMFWNSVALVVPITLGQIVIGTLAAWGFAQYRLPFKGFLFMLYIVLMMMPFQVTMVPSYLVLDKLKLIDTRWAVILPGIFSTFSVFLLRQFFMSVPFDLIEAVRMDSKSELRLFISLAIPLGKTGIASLSILTFLDNWNLIEPPMIFMSKVDSWPLSLYLSRIGESNVNVAMAASIITLLPTLLLFLYCESYLVRGIQMVGMKE